MKQEPKDIYKKGTSVMRKVKSATFSHESWEEMTKAGRYNPARKLIYRDKHRTRAVTISAGDADSIDVYREGSEIFVLSRNNSLGYIGLEVFIDGEALAEAFFQGEAAIDALGCGNPSPLSIIKRLSEYI